MQTLRIVKRVNRHAFPVPEKDTPVTKPRPAGVTELRESWLKDVNDRKETERQQFSNVQDFFNPKRLTRREQEQLVLDTFSDDFE